MIKTVSINLNKVVFQIDEDAYEALKQYLNSLNQYYKYTEGRDEIVSDIEARLAELFTESFERSGFDVISMGDVEEVIEVMGRPEDFDDDGERMEEGEGTDQSRSSAGSSSSGGTTTIKGKRLYRNPDDAIIAGVSSGLSSYFGIDDPIWIRIVFILFTIGTLGTIGPIVYILLWVILMPAETSSQKLEMKGQPINVSNLEKKIKEEFEKAGDNLKGFASGNNREGGLNNIVNLIGRVFGAVAKLAWAFAKVIFFIIITAMAIGMIVTFISLLVSFLIALPVAIKYIFANAWGWISGGLGGLLVIGIPLFFLFYIPFRLWGRKKYSHNRAIIPVAIGLFVIGLISLGASTAEVASYFSTTEMETQEEMIDYPMSDTLYLSVNDEESAYRRLNYDVRLSNIFSFTDKLETASDWIELDVLPSRDGNIYLEKRYSATGKNNKRAASNAESITHTVNYSNDELKFDEFFGLGKNRKWRNQKVNLKLYVPDSLVVSFDRQMGSILDNVDNSVDAGSHTIAGNRWLMSNGVLEPIDSVLAVGSEWSKSNMDRFDLTDFSNVTILGNVEVEVIYGSDYEVYMSGDNRITKFVEMEKRGDELIIHNKNKRKGRISLGWNNSIFVRPHIYITMPEMQRLEVNNLAHVVLKDLEQEDLEVWTFAQGSVDMQNVSLSSLTIDMNGQSSIDVTGNAEELHLESSGQSNMDGEDFTADRVYLNMSAQSDAELTVNDLVEGVLKGQSDFEYWGNPNVDVTTLAQSDIDKN